MIDDVIINKIETIKRCIKRIHEEYVGFEDEFYQNYTKQDSIILNLERLSQATIDISTHIIRVEKFGIPKTSREVFVLLEENKILSKEISHSMQKMVGFRNLAVHDYQNLNLDIVVAIVINHLKDFDIFIKEIQNENPNR
ncbi:MAG: hypothetical protein KU38_00895 [Sulfurovum sp. FS08-3]|nr:MAG: hypothetical protein KU38_00895 [Sulfurovum sp. FS08-3]